MARILVADDYPPNRLLLKHILRLSGHEIFETENGLQALAVLRDTPIDLVLLDIEMPELDGLATLEIMKETPTLKHIPAAVLSANYDSEIKEAASSLGAIGFLAKPIKREHLETLVANALE